MSPRPCSHAAIEYAPELILAALASVGGQPQNGEPDGTRQQFVDGDPLTISVQGIQKSANAKTFFLKRSNIPGGIFQYIFGGTDCNQKGDRIRAPKTDAIFAPQTCGGDQKWGTKFDWFLGAKFD